MKHIINLSLLEKAIDVQASFVVGNAKGTDKLVINYLKECGYELNQQDNYFSAKAQLNINFLDEKNKRGCPLSVDGVTRI